MNKNAKAGTNKAAKKKTSIGKSAFTKRGQPNRHDFPPAGGRKYKKRYRGQGR